MEREVCFYSGPCLRLVGVLETPIEYEETGVQQPGIVLCQGPGGYKDPDIITKDTLMPAVSSWLVKVGYVVLRFYYRGVGKSEGTEYRLIPLEQAEDIRSAISFMEQQQEVDASRIGLWGAATGGANVSYVAGIDSRVKCMVSVSGVGDGERWMRAIRRYWEWRELQEKLEEDRVSRVLTGKSRYVQLKEIIVPDPATVQYAAKMREANPEYNVSESLLSLESAEAIINYRPESVVNSISPRAAMWICAGEDTLIPIDESRNMYEKAGEPKKLVVLEGVKHHDLYHDSAFDRVMTYSIEWFDTYLK